MKPRLEFDGTDNGNCRVYYRARTEPNQRKAVYCFQIESYRAKSFQLYRCSKDGEPSHAAFLHGFSHIDMPEGDESTARDLRAWLTINAGEYTPQEPTL